MIVTHYRDLRVYQRAFKAAMRIFELSRKWPSEERYSLTDQIRRSSRSTCGSIAEAWRKRRYEGHFVAKLTDADAEAAETQNWLDFAQACGYLVVTDYELLYDEYDAINAGLVRMMEAPSSWCGLARAVHEEDADYGPPPSSSPALPHAQTPTRSVKKERTRHVPVRHRPDVS